MIFGVGTDIIEIKRIEQAIARFDNRFLDRIYTIDEQEYCLRHRDSARHFSGRFAAKEAVIKALGTGFRNGISWVDIEIKNNGDGKPEVTLSYALMEMVSMDAMTQRISLSISHCRDYATAFAVWSG